MEVFDKSMMCVLAAKANEPDDQEAMTDPRLDGGSVLSNGQYPSQAF